MSMGQESEVGVVREALREAALGGQASSPATALLTQQEEKEGAGSQDGFVRALCAIIAEDGGTPGKESAFADVVGLSAAIALKNVVRRHWDKRTEGGAVGPIADLPGARAMILTLAFSPAAAGPLRPFLLETIRLIATADFPQEWRELLPALRDQKLKPFILAAAGGGATPDGPGMAMGVEILLCCVRLFESSVATWDVMSALKYTLDETQETVFALFELLATLYLKGDLVDPLLALALANVIDIFHCFHRLTIPEFFEDRVNTMAQFANQLLTAPPNQVLENAYKPTSSSEPKLHQKIKINVLKLWYEYVSRYQEECLSVVVDTTKAVMLALNAIPTGAAAASSPPEEVHHNEELAAHAFACIAHIVRVLREPEYDPYLQIPSFQDLLSVKVILPHVVLELDDLQLLVDDTLLIARQELDITASSASSSMSGGLVRESAAELMRSLLTRDQEGFGRSLQETIVSFVPPEVDSGAACLRLEAAIFLLCVYCAEHTSSIHGVVKIRAESELINFIEAKVLPVLNAPCKPPYARDDDDDAHLCSAYLKLSALKMVAAFRNFLPVPAMNLLVRSVFHNLVDAGRSAPASAASLLVRTTAAYTLEKLLTFRPRHLDAMEFLRASGPEATAPAAPGSLDYLDFSDAALRAGLAEEVLPTLLQAISSDARGENEFLPRCLWRVVTRLGTLEGETGVPYAQLFKSTLDAAQSTGVRGSNPTFLHYMFEATVATAKTLARTFKDKPHELVELHGYVMKLIEAQSQGADEAAQMLLPYLYQTLGALIGLLPSVSTAEVGGSPWLAKFEELYVKFCRESVLQKARWTGQVGSILGVIDLVRSILSTGWLLGTTGYTSLLPAMLDGFNLALSRREGLRGARCGEAATRFLIDILAYLPQREACVKFAPLIVKLLLGFIGLHTPAAQSPSFIRIDKATATVALSTVIVLYPAEAVADPAQLAGVLRTFNNIIPQFHANAPGAQLCSLREKEVIATALTSMLARAGPAAPHLQAHAQDLVKLINDLNVAVTAAPPSVKELIRSGAPALPEPEPEPAGGPVDAAVFGAQDDRAIAFNILASARNRRKAESDTIDRVLALANAAVSAAAP